MPDITLICSNLRNHYSSSDPSGHPAKSERHHPVRLRGCIRISLYRHLPLKFRNHTFTWMRFMRKSKTKSSRRTSPSTALPSSISLFRFGSADIFCIRYSRILLISSEDQTEHQPSERSPEENLPCERHRKIQRCSLQPGCDQTCG